jgi:hypothetical protein
MQQQEFYAAQRAARANARHYDESCDFYGMMEAGTFDEEVQHADGWLGLIRDESGMLQVYAEYVNDAVDATGNESGTGWWLV